MSTGTWLLLALALAVLLAVFVGGVRVGAKLPPASPARTQRPGPPEPGGKGWEPTAVYLPHDRHGGLLYSGISNSPQRRAEQHVADDKDWPADVAHVEAWWFPDRYCALAVEWFVIEYLRPPNNTAPSGSCDRWTEPRPPIVPARVRWPSTVEAKARTALRRAS